jgi:hypothetical protein
MILVEEKELNEIETEEISRFLSNTMHQRMVKVALGIRIRHMRFSDANQGVAGI